jgi:starch synthase (maltosyl-transferring)
MTPLDYQNLAALTGPATWQFVANAGDGRTVQIEMSAQMLQGRNTTLFHFARPSAARASGKQLPAHADVRLTVRLDIEDRNFHWETHRNGGAEFHFDSHTRDLQDRAGFAFRPATDRQLQVYADSGVYHPAPEWSQNIPHPVEQSRGQVGSGDAYSPGWFEIPLPKGSAATLVVTAEAEAAVVEARGRAQEFRPAEVQDTANAGSAGDGAAPGQTAFLRRLESALGAFVVRRGAGQTVIAGYPWFLDWGRDTFICARGLLAAGLTAEVADLLTSFARFEDKGTLPNTILGEDASNRDTSDAPLWFGLVCEELAALAELPQGVSAVLESIGRNYMSGTPNGIRMDPASALVWSPSHFTWMDTNYPACTPRQGYPIELQALWIRLLRQLARLSPPDAGRRWDSLAAQALASLEQLFWLEARGYFTDVLLAQPGQAAAQARPDDALRSNCLVPLSLGLLRGERAQRCVQAAQRYLVIPGALRSLAPLPVTVPLPLYSNDGRLLNNPSQPYWGHYQGDEDTRRKPAYHNGTAWTWTLPLFCEALARAWNFSPASVSAARAYLGSMARLLTEGCLGQLPEVLDGDAPHTQRGCDAQAWGATEALRVLRLLAP